MYITEENISIVEEEFVLQAYSKPTNDYRLDLYNKYKEKFKVNPKLNRSLISFQANKNEPFYRWFKYKEGFSSTFVNEILKQYGNPNTGQVVLDPFAGMGTTITTAVKNGFDSIGIEVLPPGILATEVRIISQSIDPNQLKRCIDELDEINFENKKVRKDFFFKHLSITKGAFPIETEYAIANINKYLSESSHDLDIKKLIKFAVNSVLEEVSFTRKDGQYLRWDYRSNRVLKSKFSKGIIHPFKDKLISKLIDMYSDISKREQKVPTNQYTLINGSCLFELNKIKSESVDLVITSPPYCNRYDYTRTYALELAYNGIDDNEIKKLRQTLLSATVENKSKFRQIASFYTMLGKRSFFDSIVDNFRELGALKETLGTLEFHRKKLNNKNIPNMVANYFFEMNFVIHELSRILKPGGKIIMVNDNVRYNGDEIQVDLLLSEFGEHAGLETEKIWVLERGKGNSSQQMGVHGRQELRKCVYAWSKTI